MPCFLRSTPDDPTEKTTPARHSVSRRRQGCVFCKYFLGSVCYHMCQTSSEWHADIHAEWMRSVLADRPDLTVDGLDRTRAVMERHLPEAVVTGYAARAAELDLPHAGGLHVLAAAIEGGADRIVTGDLRDFPADRLGVHTASPRSIAACSAPICSRPTPKLCSRPFAATRRNPPRTANEHRVALERLGLIRTASLNRPHQASI